MIVENDSFYTHHVLITSTTHIHEVNHVKLNFDMLNVYVFYFVFSVYLPLETKLVEKMNKNNLSGSGSFFYDHSLKALKSKQHY